LSPSGSGVTPNHVTVARVGNGVPVSLVHCLLQGITQSLAVSLRTTSLTNIQQFYTVLTFRLCVLYGPQNKLQLLSYTQSTGWGFFL
jgi:hypothetical protein